MGVYVDDILLTGDDLTEMISLKSFLDAEFKIKDLGSLHFFLGIEFIPTEHGLLMSQRKFIAELLQEFSWDSSHAVVSPLDLRQKLSPEEGDLLHDPLVYRQLIGKLNFLINTRPDLAYSVKLLSQFNQAPRQPYLIAAYHVLSYLKGTQNKALLLDNTTDFRMQAYYDADWATCPYSRKSISGFVVSFGKSLISWKSKKQQSVSLSSAEAEYRSIRRVCTELAWLSRLFTEVGISEITPIPIKCDNQAVVYIARNPVFHERTKHIELDCHFTRENC